MLQEAVSAGIRNSKKEKSGLSLTNCVVMIYLRCAFQIIRPVHNLCAMLC